MIRAEKPFLVLELFEGPYRNERLLASPATTLYDYRRAIRLFSQYLERPAVVFDLEKQTLLDFRRWRIESGPRHRRGTTTGRRSIAKTAPPPLSFATVNKDLRVLAALAKYAFDESFIAAAPRKTTALTEPKRQPEGYHIDDIMRLLDACAKTPGEIVGLPAGMFWWSLFSAVYDTGLRRTTLFTRTYADLNFATARIKCVAESQKQRADQTRELHPDTMTVLARMREFGHELIWPWPHVHNTFYKAVRKIRARAGLRRMPKKPVHGLRSSHATYLFDKFGLDAARDACGHSSAQVTERHYIDRTLLTDQPGARSLPRPEAFPLDAIDA
jgi:integrase